MIRPASLLPTAMQPTIAECLAARLAAEQAHIKALPLEPAPKKYLPKRLR